MDYENILAGGARLLGAALNFVSSRLIFLEKCLNISYSNCLRYIRDNFKWLGSIYSVHVQNILLGANIRSKHKCGYQHQELEVNNLLPQEEELYQETERFLEYCLGLRLPNVGVQEFYNELAAAKGMKAKELKNKLSMLHLKISTFKKAFDELKNAGDQFEATVLKEFPDWPFKDATDLERVEKVIDFCSCPLSVKLFKTFTSCNRKFHKTAADIVEDFWDYLLPDAKKALQAIAYSMLRYRSKNIQGWGVWTFNKYLRSIKPICGEPLYKVGLLAGKSNNEALRFISAVLNAVGQGDPDEGLYNAEVMKQFLDLLVEDFQSNPSKLVPYTKEMSERARSLISGVEIEE